MVVVLTALITGFVTIVVALINRPPKQALKQLKPNGGSSMYDMVSRLDERLERMEGRSERLEQGLDRIDQRGDKNAERWTSVERRVIQLEKSLGKLTTIAQGVATAVDSGDKRPLE